MPPQSTRPAPTTTPASPSSPTSTSIDAGRLVPGARADLVVIDRQRLDDSVEHIEEDDMAGFPGGQRLVRRNDETVRAVMIDGNIAWRNGAADPSLETSHDLGDVLPSAPEQN